MNWLTAIEKFAQALPGFQRRTNQDELAFAVEQAFEEDSHIFAQAGCGTGKSFAGIIPAISHSLKTGRPVIYSTATKALQDQLAYKDLPFLQTIFDFNFAVLKGRSNYACHAKVDELDPYLKTQLLKAFDEEGFSGEIADLGLSGQDSASISTSSEECPGKNECPFGSVCFAEAAKAKAKTSNIVVANHSLVIADQAIQEAQEAAGIPADKVVGILPRFGGIVVDEAHELADVATNSLGGEVTEGSYGRLGKIVTEFLGEKDATVQINDKAGALFGWVSTTLRARVDKRSKSERIYAQENKSFSDLGEALRKTLQGLQAKVENFEVRGDDKKLQQKKRLAKRLANAQGKVLALLTLPEDQLVLWLEEGDAKKGNSIKWAPLVVDEFLRRNLWAKAPAVLMSATLALGSDFSFLAGQLGVDDYRTFDAGTPFDFTKQAMTFIPQIASPAGRTTTEWRSASIAIMGEVLRASNGRALLLFTSKVELEEAVRALAPIVKKMGHRALIQGQGSNRDLAREFASDEHSVLFGLKSFFTGIDVQGDALRVVYINKAPFETPTVIFSARCEALDKKYGKWSAKGGFNGLAVPTMILTASQMYGRGVRTVTDRVLVVLGDSRLYGDSAAKYGPRVIAALPNAPIVTELSDAIEYLEELEGAK